MHNHISLVTARHALESPMYRWLSAPSTFAQRLYSLRTTLKVQLKIFRHFPAITAYPTSIIAVEPQANNLSPMESFRSFTLNAGQICYMFYQPSFARLKRRIQNGGTSFSITSLLHVYWGLFQFDCLLYPIYMH